MLDDIRGSTYELRVIFRIPAILGLILLVASMISVGLAILQIAPNMIGFFGLVSIAPSMLLLAVGMVGPVGHEGAHNVWTVTGMGGQGG